MSMEAKKHHGRSNMDSASDGPFLEGAKDEHGTAIGSEAIEAGAEIIWAHFYDVLPYGSDTARELALSVFEAMARLEKRTSK